MLHPFLTSADKQAYASDTHGRISTPGGPVMFSYPGIEHVFLDRVRLPVLRSGPNLKEVQMPAGVHDVVIQASLQCASLELPDGLGGGVSTVTTAQEFADRAGALAPGNELVVKNGVYADWGDLVVTCTGSPELPVVIRPETPGGAIFHGNTRFEIRGSHLVFRGFRFEHAGLSQVMDLTEGENNRITQCLFFHCGNPEFTFSHIVRLVPNCSLSRVDHCFFTGSKSISLGNRVFDGEEARFFNRFDHNVFRDIFRFWSNGQENVQIWGQSPEIRQGSIVEYCLFDHAWADPEIISSKSSGNIFRYNTAAHCLQSAFNLRGGNNAHVEGNVMINNADGVHVYGQGHVVVNNLFIDLHGTGIVLQVGVRPGDLWDQPGQLYAEAQDVLIAHNTFVCCGVSAISSDVATDYAPIPVRNSRILNNLVVGRPTGLLNLAGSVDSTLDSNLLWASGQHFEMQHQHGGISRDPLLHGTGPGIEPAANSPSVGQAAPMEEVQYDRWRRPRPHGSGPDIGADEVGGPRPPDMRPELPTRPAIAPALARGPFARSVKIEDSDGGLHLKDGSHDLGGDLPADFVMEWEYLPESYASSASVTFAGGEDGTGYTLSWGGTDDEGLPHGLITLHKGASQEPVVTAPDPQCHRMNYRRGTLVQKPERPRPERWYAFTLIKRDELIWVGLVYHSPIRGISTIPVLVWSDRGYIGGPRPEGTRAEVAQQEAGSWRGITVWHAGRAEPGAPRPPQNVSAGPNGGGRVCLTWRPGDRGRSSDTYEIHRNVEPDFSPTEETCIAPRVLGERYDDFTVDEETQYWYRIRARSPFGLTSGFSEVGAATGSGGPIYRYLDAASARNVRAPMVVHHDPDRGEAFVWAPPYTGSPRTVPRPDEQAEFTFHVPTEATYAIWAWTRSDNTMQNSLYLSVDREPLESYQAFFARVSDSWHWGKARCGGLSPGEHTITLKPRAAGARLRALLITDDLALVPAP
jgi:poly(beta-D-mannuronate) lyase